MRYRRPSAGSSVKPRTHGAASRGLLQSRARTPDRFAPDYGRYALTLRVTARSTLCCAPVSCTSLASPCTRPRLYDPRIYLVFLLSLLLTYAMYCGFKPSAWIKQGKLLHFLQTQLCAASRSVCASCLIVGRHKNLEMSCTSRKSVAPARNRILVYPDSDEDDEEYCSLPPLLPCFQNPQPCAIINYVHHNSHNKVDIDNMTIEEYARYELTMSTMKSEIQVPTQGFTSQFFNQSQHTPNPPLDKEDSSLDEILDDLFKIGAENLRKMEHEIPNRCDDITDYVDSDQEDGELPDLPTFPATNEFASDSEQVEKNIDIAEEKEEVPMKDVEMDENHDIDHSGTEEALQ
ncbi:hypothetical protein Tco_1030266 [Tanacetum coccineum]|uniref:Uncharacterized protein n=1 Tax=Tanacetum coccineum TaxID=301880 RepID=A0ABQ5G761_9ASTR